MLTVRDKLLLGLWLLPVALGLVVGLSTGDEDGSVMLFVTGLVAALYVVVLISTVLSARRRRAQPLALPPGSAVTGMLSTGPVPVAGGFFPPGSTPTGTVPAAPGESGAGERSGGEGGPARPDPGPGAGPATGAVVRSPSRAPCSWSSSSPPPSTWCVLRAAGPSWWSPPSSSP